MCATVALPGYECKRESMRPAKIDVQGISVRARVPLMSESTVIIKGRMDDLKLYRDVLAEQGIDSQIINPDCETSS